MNENFNECRKDGVVYMVSPLLESRHAFTTRFGGVSEGYLESLNLGESRGDKPENVRENYRRLCAAMHVPSDQLVFSRQVHGTAVRTVTEADVHSLFAPIPYEADGLVTNEPGLVLTVFTADCVPVLLEDRANRVIGAVHCGWRSSVGDILREAVTAMCAIGAKIETIRAAIGPSIGACCFETGIDVPEDVERYIGVDAKACIREKPGVPGKYLVDLRNANRLRLLQLGLTDANIALSTECTMCKSEKYWSHRATKGQRGSQASLIML